MKKTKPLIVANWKMNPDSGEKAKALFVETKRSAVKNPNVKVIVCPPYIYLHELGKLKDKAVLLGAQDASTEPGGSFTGEISALMLKHQGEGYVIIGHSERRALGENDDLIAKKVVMSLKTGLKVILCVGENIRDGHGEYLHFLREQLIKSLSGVSKKFLKNLIVAYEPVWAIGKTEAEAMNARDLHETSLYLKKVLSELYGVKAISDLKIIYGGSVNHLNAKNLLELGQVQGLLVGHESLSPRKFEAVIKSLN